MIHRHHVALAVAVCLSLGTAVAPNSALSSQLETDAAADVIKTAAEPVDAATASPESNPLSAQNIEQNLEGDFSVRDIAATGAWAESLNIADWLGPLAPIALSPFFGITMLSGLALWGPEWMTDNALLGSTGPLKNPLLFCVFLVLTILTSLPRLTKVSKPFAQALDRIEAYSVIIILLIIKVVSSMHDPAAEQTAVAVVQLGIFSVTADMLLVIAMVINVLVINSVKFFFEFLVWLTPIPTLDAIFEVCNKTTCAALMALYAFSPTLATLVNLTILAVALLLFRWISRRVRFYRTMLVDPVLARLWNAYGTPSKPELIVFPRSDYGPFAAKSRLRLTRQDSGDWQLKEANWWMPADTHSIPKSDSVQIRQGWVMHSITAPAIDGGEATELLFSRRYDNAFQQLADSLGLTFADQPNEETADNERIAAEFA